jgi:dCTP deaminase
MGILQDVQLRAHVSAVTPELVLNLDLSSLEKDVRGCAIDLHVGEIFRPGTDKEKPGSADHPLKLAVTLKEGETALVRTREIFKLDAEHAAFVFPANQVSIQGLLMTNPGHVDPGYEGPIHVTVINMGRAAFPLRPGDRLLRAIIHRLDGPAVSPLAGSLPSPVTQELLSKLSPDFLSVQDRTAAAAKKEVAEAVKRGTLLQYLVPALASAVAVVATHYLEAAHYDARLKRLEEIKVKERLSALELNYPTAKVLLELQEQIKALQTQTARAAGTPAQPKATKH